MSFFESTPTICASSMTTTPVTKSKACITFDTLSSFRAMYLRSVISVLSSLPGSMLALRRRSMPSTTLSYMSCEMVLGHSLGGGPAMANAATSRCLRGLITAGDLAGLRKNSCTSA